MYHRRLLLGLIGAGAVAPGMLFAQQARMPLVAVLFIGDTDDERAAKTFFETMARHGWVEGKNIAYERHSGNGMPQFLETMVGNATGSEPAVIVATTASLAAAVQKVNATQPLVFVTMADPVAVGLVANLAKPGGNATGSYQMQGDASSKRYAFVHQAFPGLKRMGAVFDRNAPEFQKRKAAHEKSARAAGIELKAAEFTNFEAIARIFAQYRRDGIRVCEVTPSFQLTGRRREAVTRVLGAGRHVGVAAHGEGIALPVVELRLHRIGGAVPGAREQRVGGGDGLVHDRLAACHAEPCRRWPATPCDQPGRILGDGPEGAKGLALAVKERP